MQVVWFDKMRKMGVYIEAIQYQFRREKRIRRSYLTVGLKDLI